MKAWLKGLSPFFLSLLVVVLAEFGIRAAESLRLLKPSTRSGLVYMDEKRDAFLERFLPRATEPGMLILGSSTADTNIDPVRLSRVLERTTGTRHSIFNGALYGTRLEDNLFFVEWYHKQWKYDHLVLNIEPGILRPGTVIEGLMQAKLAKNPVEWWLMDNSALFRFRDQVKLRAPQDSLRSEWLMKFDAETTSHGWNRTLAVTQYIDRETPMADIVRYMPTWGIDYGYVEQIAEGCERRGVKLTIVMLPWRPDIMERLPERWSFEDIGLEVRAIAASRGVAVVDLSALEFGDEFWFDASHLNAHGAAAMTVLLGDRLGRVLASGELDYREPAGSGAAALRALVSGDSGDADAGAR